MVLNCSHLVHEFVGIRDGMVLDRVVLVRGRVSWKCTQVISLRFCMKSLLRVLKLSFWASASASKDAS